MKIYFMQKLGNMLEIVKKKTRKMKEMNSNYSFFEGIVTGIPSNDKKMKVKSIKMSVPEALTGLTDAATNKQGAGEIRFLH